MIKFHGIKVTLAISINAIKWAQIQPVSEKFLLEKPKNIFFATWEFKPEPLALGNTLRKVNARVNASVRFLLKKYCQIKCFDLNINLAPLKTIDRFSTQSFLNIFSLTFIV